MGENIEYRGEIDGMETWRGYSREQKQETGKPRRKCKDKVRRRHEDRNAVVPQAQRNSAGNKQMLKLWLVRGQ